MLKLMGRELVGRGIVLHSADIGMKMQFLSKIIYERTTEGATNIWLHGVDLPNLKNIVTCA